MRERNGEEAKLRKRLRFLLPTPIAVFLVLGLACMAADAAATRYKAGLLQIGVLETALVFNIVLRWRTASQLRRMQIRAMTGHCLNCGYGLRATAERCPECGTQMEKRR